MQTYEQIMTKYLDWFNGDFQDMLDELHDNKYSVGQAEISKICNLFQRELNYQFMRVYWQDEILQHPELDTEQKIRDFLDTIDDREKKRQEFISRFEEAIGEEEEDNLSHMTGDLDMCGTTVTAKTQPINPKRQKAIDKWKEVLEKAKDPDDGRPEIEF